MASVHSNNLVLGLCDLVKASSLLLFRQVPLAVTGANLCHLLFHFVAVLANIATIRTQSLLDIFRCQSVVGFAPVEKLFKFMHMYICIIIVVV